MGYNPKKDYLGYDGVKTKEFFENLSDSARDGKIISWGFTEPPLKRDSGNYHLKIWIEVKPD